jgi:hypothetical protein
MMRSNQYYVIGSDLNGRRCRVALVRVPAYLDDARALQYIQNIVYDPETMHKPYAAATEVEPEHVPTFRSDAHAAAERGDW